MPKAKRRSSQTPDPIGRYKRITPADSAEIFVLPTINKGEFAIRGTAFWGENRQSGPNIGEIDYLGKLQGRALRSKNGLNSLTMTFNGEKIEVLEKCEPATHGHNVTFSGTYFRTGDEHSNLDFLTSIDDDLEATAGEVAPSIDYSASDKLTISFGEIVGLLSLIYICSFAAFNAGYFINIPGHFEILFNFADLLSSNISIVQYFVVATSLFFSISLFYSWLLFLLSELLPGARSRLNRSADTLALTFYRNDTYFWIAFGLLLLMVNLIPSLIRAFGVYDFSVSIAPHFIFQGTLIYFSWIGYKNSLISAKRFAFTSLSGLFFFSFISGSSWLRSEIHSSRFEQAIVLNDGLCLERRILRSSSNGLLLYSFSLRQFEFRSRESIKTIFDRKGC